MDMNNEMDELFRKAGEDYPLNLGKPDWDAVAGKLQTDTGDLGPGFGMNAAVPRKRRRLLWLLLLLPLGIYGVTALVGSGRKVADSGQLAVGNKQKPADGGQSGDGGKAPAGNGNPETAGRGSAPVGRDSSAAERGSSSADLAVAKAADSQATSIPDGNPGKNRASLGQAAPGLKVQTTTAPATGKSSQTNPLLSQTNNHTRSPAFKKGRTPVPATASAGIPWSGIRGTAGNANGSAGNRIAGNDSEITEVRQTIKGSGKSAAGPAEETKTTETRQSAPKAENVEPAASLADMVMAERAGGTDSAHNGNQPTTGKQPAKQDKKAVVHPSVKQNRGLYAGLVAGPDFSTIKFQTMKSTGYSFGIVAGYRLNRHFSIETGLSWDRKKYYSSGEYFDKSKTKIPPAVKVTWVDGYCEMFEIPLTARYDFSIGKKGQWFAAAGLTSYLMKNENYLYGTSYNNVIGSRYADYKNSGNNFFSVAQFSMGYEYNVGRRNVIRVEPYFKAPLNGVGIGSLPISSVGMTFGFVHSFR